MDRGPGERIARGGNAVVKRVPYASVLSAATTHQEDFVLLYVEDLRNVVDMEAIRAARLSASTMTIATNASTSTGTFTLRIRGTSGGVTHSFNVQLIVQ